MSQKQQEVLVSRLKELLASVIGVGIYSNCKESDPSGPVHVGPVSVSEPNIVLSGKLVSRCFSYGIDPSNPLAIGHQSVEIRFFYKFENFESVNDRYKLTLTVQAVAVHLNEILDEQTFETDFSLSSSSGSRERESDLKAVMEEAKKESMRFWGMDPRLGFYVITPSPLFDNEYHTEPPVNSGYVWCGGVWGWSKGL